MQHKKSELPGESSSKSIDEEGATTKMLTISQVMFTRVNLNIFFRAMFVYTFFFFPLKREVGREKRYKQVCGRKQVNIPWHPSEKIRSKTNEMFFFPPFSSSCSLQTQTQKTFNTFKKMFLLKEWMKREQFLVICLCIVFIFLWNFSCNKLKTHLFLQLSGQQCLLESIFDTNWVRTQFSGHNINYTRWITRPKFNFRIFYATTVHRSMEIQFHKNWFPLFAFTCLIKRMKSRQNLSLSLDKMNFEFFGSDEFCRSSNTNSRTSSFKQILAQVLLKLNDKTSEALCTVQMQFAVSVECACINAQTIAIFRQQKQNFSLFCFDFPPLKTWFYRHNSTPSFLNSFYAQVFAL